MRSFESYIVVLDGEEDKSRLVNDQERLG